MMVASVRAGSVGERWFPGAVSMVGILLVYVLWVFGHPYLALAVALIGSIVSLNHYLLSRHADGVEPYWLFFLPLFLALSLLVLLRDAHASAAMLYVLVVAFVIASSPANRLDSILGAVMYNSNWFIAVLGSAALSGLAYLYIYGIEADPVGFWVMAGPLLEYVVLMVLLDSAGDTGQGSTTLVHMYSAASSLMFLPQPFFGAYAVLVNSVKGVARGRLVPALVLGDYLIRVSLLAVLNLGRIPVPLEGF